MTDNEALAKLRAQGQMTGTPDLFTGMVRIWTRENHDAVDVRIGRELHDLAEGRLSFADIRERREDETLAEP